MSLLRFFTDSGLSIVGQIQKQEKRKQTKGSARMWKGGKREKQKRSIFSLGNSDPKERMRRFLIFKLWPLGR